MRSWTSIVVNLPQRLLAGLLSFRFRSRHDRPQRSGGLSSEIRQFSAGIRCIVGILCSLLLTHEASRSVSLLLLLIVYNAWAVYVLWSETTGRPAGRALVHYWCDVVWTLAVVYFTHAARLLMTLTLVHPIALASIGYGVTRGFLLALFAAVGLLLDLRILLLSGNLASGGVPLPMGLGVMSLGPAIALLARPMAMLRERLELVHVLEADLDPRRGLEEIARGLVGGLLRSTGAAVSGLVLPAAAGAPAMLANAEEGIFGLSGEAQARFESLLAPLPACAVTHVMPRWKGLFGTTRAQESGDRERRDLRRPLDELAGLLQVQALTVVPLLRYGQVHGHLLLGANQGGMAFGHFIALADAGASLQHLIERAALVDQLQEEFAAHERMRIGLDLHDSAIQPYLGLKYAVEGLVLGMAPDNPARRDAEALVELVESELAQLREIVSGLRSGEPRGDNALVASVRRQARRFSVLFGIKVELHLPDELPTSRAFAGAIFHMVNEALTNARKHTAARRIRISLEATGGHITLRVVDDAGSRLGQPLPDFVPTSLAERAAALGGTVRIERVNGLDTEVTITVPFRHPGASPSPGAS